MDKETNGHLYIANDNLKRIADALDTIIKMVKKTRREQENIWRTEKMHKYTITEILEAWEDCYGEDMKTEYSGFVDKLKEKKELEEVDSKND